MTSVQPDLMSETSFNITEEIFDAILPAGGHISGEFAGQAGIDIKALIPFGGQTILERAIDTLRATGRVRRIVVVGAEQTLQVAKRCGIEGTVAEGATGPENNIIGLKWLQSQPGGATNRVLITTTDLPFLTPQTLNAYIDACPADADVAIPLVTRAAYEKRFPGSAIEYVRLRDGEFTVGCTFVVNAATLLANLHHFERAFAARKSNLRMARLAGARIAWRLLTCQLTVRDIEARASLIAHCRGVAVFDTPAELAYDIDVPEEYTYAVKHCQPYSSDRTPISSPERTVNSRQEAAG